jgi:hypothetical protein
MNKKIEIPDCFKRAFDSLPEEDKKKYRDIGKYMYENFDYEKNTYIDNNVKQIKSKVKDIELAVSSGLLVEDLSKEELDLMSNELGSDWYKKYYYITENE